MDAVAEARLARLRRYVHVLDDGIRVPGTRIRFGLDPILGLLPGVGDVVGALLSGAIILEAARHGVSRLTLLRMALNVALEVGLGSVPIAGDVFDAVFKVNRINLELLERSLGRPTSKPSGGIGLFALLGGLLAVCLVVAGAVTYAALLMFGVLGA